MHSARRLLVVSGGPGSQGPLFPATAANDSTVGSLDWTNVTRITADDASSADALLSGTQVSHYAKATNFGFSVPAGRTVATVKVEVKCQNQGGSGGQANQSSMKLVKGGAIVGTDQANTGTILPGALSYVVFNPGNLWGTTLLPSDVNASTFGCVFAAQNQSGISSIDPLIDAIRMTVTWT